ncbi:MAG TPA: hypothetical protein VNK46_00300, partial [Nitrospiraceae bacterium]|jgi:predicted nucleic acid-binding protein|nr:hypothetical protein [Nitrospiraceae bacterium]
MALPALVFCDTSFFYACLDPKDTNHARAQALVTESAAAGTTFCTTWDIISETVTRLRYRHNFQAALAFLTDVKPGLRIVACGDRVREEAEHIFSIVRPRSSALLLRFDFVRCRHHTARSCSVPHL